MAKRHRHAGKAIQVVSTLPPDRLATLCKDAADGCQGRVRYSKATIRLDTAAPGTLAFSVGAGRLEFLAFEVKLGSRDGAQVMTSHITRYKTKQPTWGGLIPIGPKSVLGLNCYEQFMRRFGDLIRQADPEASVVGSG